HLAGTVAVVGTRCDSSRRRYSLGKRDRRPQLVMTQRLGRRQIQGPRSRIRFQGRQYRQLVGQRLAGRGTSAEHDVTAVAREIGGRELMRPRGLDTAINKRPHHIWVGPLRPVLWPALTRR